jgi:hypothetical protein
LSQSNPNAESPDVPGGIDIATVPANVSPVIPRNIDMGHLNFVIASASEAIH